MKTVSLRTLVREPLKVKRLTRVGNTVQVTDCGTPLWILHPAHGPDPDPDAAERRQIIDEILDEVLQEKVSPVSAARLLEDSRR